MKRSSVSFSGISRFVGLDVVLAGGGVTHAQEIPFGSAEPLNYLPANLRKGLNLPYIFGNADHLYVKGPNTPGPFAPIRLRNLLILADFETIKNDGFDHVRIPIDTRCFGVGTDGAYVASNLVPRSFRTEQPLVTAQDNIAELKATIHEAIAAGLAVIVDLHPVVVSEAHYQEIKNDNGVPTSTTPHDTVFLYDLTTTVNHPADANHPLAKFWTTFLPNFDPAEFSPSTLYFEILNEPMVGFKRERYNLNTPLSDPQWKEWFYESLVEWRGIQLNALKRALVVRPEYKFIAATPLASLQEFGEDEFSNQNSNWPSFLPEFGSAYSASELSGLPGEQGWQLVDNVIYTAHLYTPTAYTLGPNLGNPDQDKTGEFYRFNRDYVGVGHPNPNWDPFRPAILTAAQWMGRNQFSITEGGLTMSYHQASIVMTEAGVNSRHANECAEPGMCVPPIIDISQNYFLESPTHDRFWWHWDLKKNAAEFGLGYTIYEYYGHKGIGPNAIHTSSSIDQRGQRGGIFQWMHEALFGTTVVTRRSH